MANITINSLSSTQAKTILSHYIELTFKTSTPTVKQLQSHRQQQHETTLNTIAIE